MEAILKVNVHVEVERPAPLAPHVEASKAAEVGATGGHGAEQAGTTAMTRDASLASSPTTLSVAPHVVIPLAEP
jgi:hypothetical protein